MKVFAHDFCIFLRCVEKPELLIFWYTWINSDNYIRICWQTVYRNIQPLRAPRHILSNSQVVRVKTFLVHFANQIKRKFCVAKEIGSTLFGCWSLVSSDFICFIWTTGTRVMVVKVYLFGKGPGQGYISGLLGQGPQILDRTIDHCEATNLCSKFQLWVL
jgi:hypothetical protein